MDSGFQKKFYSRYTKEKLTPFNNKFRTGFDSSDSACTEFLMRTISEHNLRFVESASINYVLVVYNVNIITKKSSLPLFYKLYNL